MAKEGKPFTEYKRQGKLLKAGFNWLRERMEAEGRVLESTAWADVSLPEYLWFGLLRQSLGPAGRYDQLRELASAWPAHERQFKVQAPFTSHTFIGKGLSPKVRKQLITRIVGMGTPDALRPLLLLEHLPALSDWAEVIGGTAVDKDAELLGSILREMHDFHSDAATDACWLLYLVERLKGRLQGEPVEIVQLSDKYSGADEHSGYFRTLELNYRMMRTTWPSRFWEDVWLKWHPAPARADEAEVYLPPYWLDQLLPTYLALLQKWFWESRQGSADHVHELMFGLLFHSATIASEVIQLRADHRTLGIHSLRSICEATINFAYLMKKGDVELWLKYRDYGYGKARLISEKYKHYRLASSVVDLEWVRAFAGERQGKYLIDINLGDWDGNDLRQRSEIAEVKDVYDRYYDFTSSVSHSDWLSVNLTGYTWDLNPFHRLQHVPRDHPRLLASVAPDMIWLLDRQLSILKQAFPGIQFTFPKPFLDLVNADGLKRG
jgi:hypothetical protein